MRYLSRSTLFAAMLLAATMPVVLASGDHEGGHGGNDEQGHETGDGHGNGHGNGHGHGHGGMDFGFGKPAAADQADRTIEIVVRDSMRIEPASVTVEPGETVTFRVRNSGRMQHSFTLGTPAYQQRHDREMMDMPMDEMERHMDDSPNGIVVPPGDTRALTWTFRKHGPIEFACHIPGHYPAGMKGMLQIE